MAITMEIPLKKMAITMEMPLKKKEITMEIQLQLPWKFNCNYLKIVFRVTHFEKIRGILSHISVFQTV